VVGIVANKRGEAIDWGFLVVPLFMAIIGYAVMKMLVLDLVDEVLDLGDALLVRNAGQEERILLNNISNVSHATFTNPPRITLTLRQPSRFEKNVTFSPLLRLNPFSKDPIAEELIERVDAARQR
jgi:hypothetical protein